MKKYLLASLAITAAISAAAQYQVVVTTEDGEKKTFSTSDVNSIQFLPAPEYVKTNTFLGGTYNLRDGLGMYTFSCGTGAPDHGGNPAEVGELQFQITLYGEMSEEAHNAVLPEGFYRGGQAKAPFTIDLSNSGMWVRTGEGDDDIAVIYFIDATADVIRYEDGNYTVKITIDGLNGEQVNVSYSGKLKFTPGSSSSDDFTQNQNVDFTGGQGRYYGNWNTHFADDGLLQFYTGEFDDNGTQTQGYWLQIPYNMPKDPSHDENWTPVVTDGVYNVDPRSDIQIGTERPFTVMPGKALDFMGMIYNTGTYLSYKAASGEQQLAYIVGGTMTVSNDGKNFVFDFIADNGIKVTGTFSGNLNNMNYCDNTNATPPIDTLESDIVLDFPANAVALDYNLGHYLDAELFSHVLMFTDPAMKTGDYVTLDLLCDSENLLDGVYTINDSFENFTGIRGEMDYGGTVLYSWYGDLDSTDQYGAQETLAAIWGGTITVNTLDNGEHKFDFNLTSLNGKSITGSYTGTLNYGSEDSAKARRQAQLKRLGNIQKANLKKARQSAR